MGRMEVVRDAIDGRRKSIQILEQMCSMRKNLSGLIFYSIMEVWLINA